MCNFKALPYHPSLSKLGKGAQVQEHEFGHHILRFVILYYDIKIRVKLQTDKT